MADLESKLGILPVTAGVAGSEPSPLEKEVIALFDLMRDRLLRHLLSFRLPISDCEEIIQETFLALFQHLQRGKSGHNLPGWLFRVAHNLAIKYRQRSRRGIDVAAGASLSVEEAIVDPAPNPEDRMSTSQTHKRLQAVLWALPEQDRRCLSLRAEGLRYREIAEVLDMSLGAVALSLERSLARIARASER